MLATNLGISETLGARPIQAALASADSFAVGAAMALLIAAFAPGANLIIVSGASLLFLALWVRSSHARVAQVFCRA
jgi:vacuolar iron transporter family protein